MKESLTTDNAADFRQRYNGTIGWLTDDHGEKVLVHVTNVDTERVKFLDVSGTAYYANANKGVEFEFLPVKRAWYNTDESPVYLERVPARQFRRGIHRENTLCYRMYDGLTPANIDIKVIHEINQPTSRVLKQGSAFALSSVFAVDALSRLYCFTGQIGVVDFAKKQITLSSDLFMQEVRDCVQRNKYDFAVK